MIQVQTPKDFIDLHHSPTRIIASIPPAPLRERPDLKMDTSTELGSM